MRLVFAIVAAITTVMAATGWLLYVLGMGLLRTRGMDLFGLDNAYYWGMAVGSPFSLLALLFHPFIIDYVKNVYVRIFWTLGFVTLLVWHFVFAGAVLTNSSVSIDGNTISGLLTANDLGLIFTGAFGSVLFAGISTGVIYARDFLEVEDVK